jgi:hypothetical protein
MLGSSEARSFVCISVQVPWAGLQSGASVKTKPEQALKPGLHRSFGPNSFRNVSDPDDEPERDLYPVSVAT